MKALHSKETSAAAAALDRAGASSKWEKCWSVGLKPGECFDTAGPCKALSKFLEQNLETLGKEAFVGKKALVPGCGRAYVRDPYFLLCLST